MATIYQRGERLYCRVKKLSGIWTAKTTPFYAGAEAQAQEFADELQRTIDKAGAQAKAGGITVAAYSVTWLKERESLGVASIADDRGRINNHVLPRIGPMRIDEVKPKHIRDVVRALKKDGELAPRTIINVYGVTHTMFRDAMVEELIIANPCILKRGELPEKVDADSEWRALATYTMAEVAQLITDAAIPPERRVQYALKSLAALRHGEAAGLRWHHYDAALLPLGQLVIATSYDTGRTKTNVTRRVPVHPALAAILGAWKRDHWERIYGRAALADDLIVPTRGMTPVAANDAGRAFKDDLDTIELRKSAGKHRDRGGHDLRAWFITTCQEHGAIRELLRVVTHTSKGDVMSGYTRATWPSLCAEVAKLPVIADPNPLTLSEQFRTRELNVSKRWRKMATPTGFEALFRPAKPCVSRTELPDSARLAERVGPKPVGPVRNASYSGFARIIEDFVVGCDGARAYAIVAQLEARAAGPGSM